MALVPRATAKQHSNSRKQAAEHALLARLLEGIATRRDETWRWERMMHRARTPYVDSARRIRSVDYRKWVLHLWHRRAVKAKRQALTPPHRREWLCIHNYEAKWADPDAPYYGGLQMDREFQATYGPELLRKKGTADHWTPLEQMWVAERAYRTRGFWPWPNTARYCGLL